MIRAAAAAAAEAGSSGFFSSRDTGERLLIVSEVLRGAGERERRSNLEGRGLSGSV